MKYTNVHVALLSILFFGNAFAAIPSQPYAGQEQRNIKSMDSDEILGLLEGKGMGLARPAELNHYPGPKHVLELEPLLNLTNEQRDATRALFDTVKKEARPLGSQIVRKEKKLDEMFSRGEATQAQLKALLLEIGRLRAELRFVHLRAHLAQRALLTPKQIEQYDEARGYHGGNHLHHPLHQGHH